MEDYKPAIIVVFIFATAFLTSDHRHLLVHHLRSFIHFMAIWHLRQIASQHAMMMMITGLVLLLLLLGNN